MSTCRKCEAEIDFVETKKGRWMPVDTETVTPDECEPGDIIVNDDGHVCAAKNADRDYSGSWHISHFATCPNADDFRRNNK